MPERRMVLVLMALSLGLCDAKNIFGLEYKDEISVKKLNRRLIEAEFNPNATEVARLLAITKVKNSLPQGSGGNTIHELLKLAERSDEEPMEICKAYHFDEFRRICGSLSGPNGNARLLNYCNHCYKVQFEFCAHEIGSLFTYVVQNFYPISKLITISREISQYIVSDGEEEATEEKNISEFMSEVANPGLIGEICVRLLKTVKKALLFFDAQDKETSKFLAWVEKTESNEPSQVDVIYNRCAIIDKLASK